MSELYACRDWVRVELGQELFRWRWRKKEDIEAFVVEILRWLFGHSFHTGIASDATGAPILNPQN